MALALTPWTITSRVSATFVLIRLFVTRENGIYQASLVKSAVKKLVALLKSSTLRVAPSQLGFGYQLHVAPVKSVRLRFSPLRLIPVKFAPLRFTPSREATVFRSLTEEGYSIVT